MPSKSAARRSTRPPKSSGNKSSSSSWNETASKAPAAASKVSSNNSVTSSLINPPSNAPGNTSYFGSGAKKAVPISNGVSLHGVSTPSRPPSDPRVSTLSGNAGSVALSSKKKDKNVAGKTKAGNSKEEPQKLEGNAETPTFLQQLYKKKFQAKRNDPSRGQEPEMSELEIENRVLKLMIKMMTLDQIGPSLSKAEKVYHLHVDIHLPLRPISKHLHILMARMEDHLLSLRILALRMEDLELAIENPMHQIDPAPTHNITSVRYAKDVNTWIVNLDSAIEKYGKYLEFH